MKEFKMSGIETTFQIMGLLVTMCKELLLVCTGILFTGTISVGCWREFFLCVESAYWEDRDHATIMLPYAGLFTGICILLIFCIVVDHQSMVM